LLQLEISEEENRNLQQTSAGAYSEKEVLQEELRLAYARISELEVFIDKMRLGNQSRSKSNTSLTGK